jgi:aspartyl-tRNA(Asn)/glutamyl-tRNA(Gln) amidotransferase subunit A
MDDVTELTAGELSEGYRQQLVSPSEVLEAVLARIARINPLINAFREVDATGARQDAEASDLRWKRGEPLGLLDGVPVSIKDLILTKGVPTLRGSLGIDANQPWAVDAPSVMRLREAGAILIGKTTTPEFGCKGVTDSFLTGVSRNPYRLDKTPGGSSGGAAAAVAAGLGPLALGTDGAGSVRIPSAFCGVAGLKASFGRVPAWPASPFGTLAHIGPHARSVRDLAMALNVIARPDVRDWYSLPYVQTDYCAALDQPVAGLRVGYSANLGYATVDREIAVACRRAAEALAAAGAIVTECDPGFEDPLDDICTLWFVGAATLFASLSDQQRDRLDPIFRWQADEGRKYSAVDVSRVGVARAELGRRMREFHQRYDVLLTPTVAVPPMDVVETGAPFLADPKAFLGWTPFSYPFNLTQQPALSVPAGLNAAGLPMGVQLVASMHEDALLLRAGHALEAALEPMPRPSFVPG